MSEYKVEIAEYVEPEKENEFLEVIDALLTRQEELDAEADAAEAKGEPRPRRGQPSATLTVPAEKVGSVSRQLRDAAHARDCSARKVSETTPDKKTNEVSITFVIRERVFRKRDKNGADDTKDES